MKTHNDKAINVSGTSLQGHLHGVSYRKLVTLFGPPHKSDEYKSDAEWDIEFDDGTICTIYNWKDGKNYCGKDGLNVTHINSWHVGAKHSIDVAQVVDAVYLGETA
jgi:hypothetical protein